MSGEVWWTVVAPLRMFLVEAGSEKQAREKALKHTGYEHKPYLARGWQFRIATEDDKKKYAAFAEAHRKSEPTVRTAKRKTKSARDRLFGGET